MALVEKNGYCIPGRYIMTQQPSELTCRHRYVDPYIWTKPGSGVPKMNANDCVSSSGDQLETFSESFNSNRIVSPFVGLLISI